MVQFAQKTTPPPCHSEARFIGEESARAKAALRTDNPSQEFSNCATTEHSSMREQNLAVPCTSACEIVDCPDRLPAGVIEVTS